MCIRDRKITISHKIKVVTNALVSPNQISRWFQHHREREAKHGNSSQKLSYKKFGKEHQSQLVSYFNENPYPSLEEMTALGAQLNVSVSKIENWFKHYRRALAQKGLFEIKTRKYFTLAEKRKLEKYYISTPRPTTEGYRQIANDLDCGVLQIKNWFANKRKKQKFLFHQKVSSRKIVKTDSGKDSTEDYGISCVHEEIGDKKLSSPIKHLFTASECEEASKQISLPSSEVFFETNQMSTAQYMRVLLFNKLYLDRMASPNQFLEPATNLFLPSFQPNTVDKLAPGTTI
eukprot:TRINITY_DN11782_c0_g1_i1.p1 TRINITY_DN11782_c0_g1~~TRINITY_DN11782_c0_g1_i1.p1  ORF type:complete len:289 (+),score=20.86 TRINITY_DN11782_c0_g1_i1:65-931(+)